MFTIYGGKTEFNQWEQGQMVTNPNMAVGDKVRFWNASGETHPMIAYKHDGAVVVDVPNDLLQRASPILVDLCGKPEYMTRFMVNFVSHKEPEGYQYTDNTHCEPVVPAGEADLGDLVVSVGGDTLTWDGNTEGLVSLLNVVYKVSDAVPATDDFANGVTACINGTNQEFYSGTDGIQFADGLIVIANWAIVVVPQDLVGVEMAGFMFAEAGTYFMNDPGAVVCTSLTIPGYTGFAKKRINPEYIEDMYYKEPGEVVLVEANHVFATDSDWANHFALTGCNVGDTVTVHWNGVPYTCTVGGTSLTDAFVGNTALFAPNGVDTGEPFHIVNNGPSCFVSVAEPGEVNLKITAMGEIVHQIPVKYLPTNNFTIKLSFGDNGPGDIVIDKTFGDIYDAVLKGKTVYLDCTATGSNIIPLSSFTDSVVEFTTISVMNSSTFAQTVKIPLQGQITINSKTLT